MILVPETAFVVAFVVGGSSLLAHSAQANVSPTWADPNDGGRPRLLDSMNSWSTSGVVDGYAREAVCGILVSFSFSAGRGCCWTRDGRESLLVGVRIRWIPYLTLWTKILLRSKYFTLELQQLVLAKKENEKFL